MDTELSPAKRHARAMKTAGIFFRRQLSSSQIAKDYVVSRELPVEVLKRFGIGFAPDQWQGVVNQFSKEEDKAAAIESGLIQESKKGTVYSLFRGRLMFPVLNLEGDILGFGGRAMPGLSSTEKPKDPEQNPPPKYLNSHQSTHYDKSTVLYGAYQAQAKIAETGNVFISEGYIDVLRYHALGVSNAVASCGTAFTPEQMTLLTDIGAKNFYFSYDGDSAGRKATMAAIKVALEQAAPWTSLYVVNIGEQDPDDFLREKGLAGLKETMNHCITGLGTSNVWPFVAANCIPPQAVGYDPALDSFSLYRAVDMANQDAMVQSNFLNAVDVYVQAAKGNARAELQSFVEFYLDQPSWYSDLSGKAPAESNTFIPQHDVVLARLMAHRQAPKEILETSTHFQSVLERLKEPDSELLGLAQVMGPIPDEMLSEAAAEVLPRAGMDELSKALEEMMMVPFDDELKNNVKNQLAVDFSPM